MYPHKVFCKTNFCFGFHATSSILAWLWCYTYKLQFPTQKLHFEKLFQSHKEKKICCERSKEFLPGLLHQMWRLCQHWGLDKGRCHWLQFQDLTKIYYSHIWTLRSFIINYAITTSMPEREALGWTTEGAMTPLLPSQLYRFTYVSCS